MGTCMFIAGLFRACVLDPAPQLRVADQRLEAASTQPQGSDPQSWCAVLTYLQSQTIPLFGLNSGSAIYSHKVGTLKGEYAMSAEGVK